MEKVSKELLKEFVNSQKFTSTTDIMNSMKWTIVNKVDRKKHTKS